MPPGAHGRLGTLWSGYVENLGQVMPTGGLFLEDEQGLSWAERWVSLLEKEEGEGTGTGLRLAGEWPLEPATVPLPTVPLLLPSHIGNIAPCAAWAGASHGALAC